MKERGLSTRHLFDFSLGDEEFKRLVLEQLGAQGVEHAPLPVGLPHPCRIDSLLPRHLLDPLRALNGVQVALETTSKVRPAVLYSYGNQSYTYVIMPMHVR